MKPSNAASDLLLTGGWSIGEPGFQALCTDLREITPGSVVEFGSGPSSVRLALEFPTTRLLTIDHSPQFRDETQRLVNKYEVNERVSVGIRPLTWRLHAAALYQSYARGPFPSSIDAVIIDGPPSEHTASGAGGMPAYGHWCVARRRSRVSR